MIYEFPQITEPIRQGDIFVGIPRIDMSLKDVPILNEEGQAEKLTWNEIVNNGKEVSAVLAVRPVFAIVASQDCDTQTSRDITLCEIREFRDVERKSKETTSLKSWVNILTQHARINQKWFYLPPDDKIGFKEKMAVDFLVSLRVPKVDLWSLRSLRKGRLNPIADEHFRERISEFYRRYPYDEWYPLSCGELEEYKKNYPEVDPFPWQVNLKREPDTK